MQSCAQSRRACGIIRVRRLEGVLSRVAAEPDEAGGVLSMGESWTLLMVGVNASMLAVLVREGESAMAADDGALDPEGEEDRYNDHYFERKIKNKVKDNIRSRHATLLIPHTPHMRVNKFKTQRYAYT